MNFSFQTFLAVSMIVFYSLSFKAQTQMVFIEGGKFVMGCTSEQKPGCDGDEFPIHAIQLSSFYVGKHEVSQGCWQVIMGDNPSSNTGCGVNCPVENIDWYSVIVFCNEKTLSDSNMTINDLVYYKDEDYTIAWSLDDYNGNGDTPGGPIFRDKTKPGYRLPTESEWEFTARGGMMSLAYRFSGGNGIDSIAWYDGNSDNTTHEVGQKKPNELGVFDMTGNVWEWVWDWWGDYVSTHLCDPEGIEPGTSRIYRGGSYNFSEPSCRTADRYYKKPTRSSSNTGFRIVHGLIN